MGDPLIGLAARDETGPFALPGERATFGDFLKEMNADPAYDITAQSRAMSDVGDAFGRGVGAAYRKSLLNDLTLSRDYALAEAVDHRIRTVFEQTGVQLENPYRGGYSREAHERIDAQGGSANSQDNLARAIADESVTIFNDRLDEVKRSFPDKAKALDFYQPIAQQAQAIARAAETSGEDAGLLASLVGGGAAMFRDPVQVGALLASFGESAGATALARIAWNALRQGLFNAGAAAVSQPAVQDWRREVGLRTGVVPALEEVGASFLFGAVVGGAVHGGLEFVRAERAALTRMASGKPQPGDIATIARKLDVTLDAETRAAIATAESDMTHAAMARADLPDGLPAGYGDDAARAAIRHAEDPAQPPPAIASPASVRPDSAGAERIMADAPDPLAGVETLRGDASLIEGALHSDNPALISAGRMASLSDEAFAMVRDGRAEPGHALVVSEMSPDPAYDAAALSRLTDMRPADTADARMIVAEAIEGQNRAQQMMQGDRPPQKPRSPRGRAAADPNTWSLFEMLAREGGLMPDPELAAIFGSTRGPFVPGFGPLIRPKGRALDDALRLAKDRGYMFDAADVTGAEARLVLRDVLDRIDAESRGQKQYRLDHLPQSRETAERDTHEILSRLHDEIAETSGSPVQIDKTIEDRVVQIMTREGETDVMTALERAILEDADRYEAYANARRPDPDLGDIPGWDLPDDGGPAPKGGGSDPAGGGPPRRPDGGASGTDGAEPRTDGARDRAPEGGDVSSSAVGMPDGTKRDVIDLVPVLRDDGSVMLATREALDALSDEQEGLANLVKACNT